MNNIKAVSKDLSVSNNLFAGSTAQTNYQWENLVIEKRVTINWLDKLYKVSPLHAFWTVLSSPAG